MGKRSNLIDGVAPDVPIDCDSHGLLSQLELAALNATESDLLFSPSLLTTLRLQINIQATNVRNFMHTV